MLNNDCSTQLTLPVVTILYHIFAYKPEYFYLKENFIFSEIPVKAIYEMSAFYASYFICSVPCRIVVLHV
jgi:hypothetical protein